MRLFVALDIDERVRTKLAELLAELRRANTVIKWVTAESLHITLKFIGEQPESRLAALGEALASVPVPGAVELACGGLGVFPNERRPRVLWAGVRAPAELAKLAADIDEVTASFGVERESRPFSPHLTLGRAREGGRAAAGGPPWEQHRNDDFGVTRAAAFYLYQSKLSPSGAQYTKLRSFPLA